jgi:hypothetical protein
MRNLFRLVCLLTKSVRPLSCIISQAISAASACRTDSAPETTARSNPLVAGNKFSAMKRAVAMRAACAESVSRAFIASREASAASAR